MNLKSDRELENTKRKLRLLEEGYEEARADTEDEHLRELEVVLRRAEQSAAAGKVHAIHEVRIVLRRLGRLDIAAQAVGLCLNLGDRHQFDRREIDEFDVGAPCLKLCPKCGGALS